MSEHGHGSSFDDSSHATTADSSHVGVDVGATDHSHVAATDFGVHADLTAHPDVAPSHGESIGSGVHNDHPREDASDLGHPGAVGVSGDPGHEQKGHEAAPEETIPLLVGGDATPGSSDVGAIAEADRLVPTEDDLPHVAPQPTADAPNPGDPGDVEARLRSAAPPDKAAGPAPSPRKKRLVLKVIGVIAAVLVVAAILGAVWGVPWYVRARIVREAASRGLDLAFEEVDWSEAHVRLTGVTLSLHGVRGLRATAKTLDVPLRDWAPERASAQGLMIDVAGLDALRDLSAWNGAHPDAAGVPFSAAGASLCFRPSEDGAVWVTLENIAVTASGTGGAIGAAQAIAFGKPVPGLDVTWLLNPKGRSFTAEARSRVPALSNLKVTLFADARGGSAKASLAKSAWAPIATAFALPLPDKPIDIEADVEVPLPAPGAQTSAPLAGSATGAVHGATIPHPRELDGILFGKTIRASSKFEIAADRTNVGLSDVTVESGALKLTGSGSIVAEPADAVAKLSLKGSIPCTMVASSAASAHFGGAWGAIAGSIAKRAVRGSVGVHVAIEGRATNPGAAKIVPSASVGCKLGL